MAKRFRKRIAQMKTDRNIKSILLLSCREICDLIQKREITSFEIVEALYKQYNKHQNQINAVAINLFEEAFTTAKQYDELAAKDIFVGPLHGLPISIKENIDIKGFATTLGIKDSRITSAKEDAEIVKILKSLGAIIICKSNVPEGLIPMDCNNSVYGQTFNPWNKDFVTGGSSSGEAALIASGQSFLGIGTDLGGSIRFPAAFCGIAGFKPTRNALPRKGVFSVIRGQNVIVGDLGPMARKVDDLIFMMDNLYKHKFFENSSRKLLNPELKIQDCNISKMKIGYYTYDGFIKAAPALEHVVEESIEILRSLGAEVVEIPCNNQKEIIKRYLSISTADGQKTFLERFKLQKKPIPQMRNMFRLAKLSNTSISILTSILKIGRENRLSEVITQVKKKTVYEFWKMTDEIEYYKQEEMDFFKENKLDAIICPASALTSVLRGLEGEMSIIFSYFGRYNVLGFPAGVVPMRKVNKDELVYTDIKDRLYRRMAKSTLKSEGMPVGVQVVANQNNDYKALYIMKLLEENRKFQFDYPF